MAQQTVTISVEEFQQLVTRVTALEQKLEELTKPNNQSQKEMTDAHALQVLNGDMKDTKHNDCAKKLGLSYGQVYSCRLGYTFKHIHKQLKAQGFVNPWIKE